MSLDSLKLMLMRQKIAAAGMDVSDFSRISRPMVSRSMIQFVSLIFPSHKVPLSGDRWRGDGNVV